MTAQTSPEATGGAFVIVNADDFGYSTDTVEATIDCLERGVVTSASIMPNMSASDEALAYARGRPDFSFGVHLSLVGDWLAHPVAGREDVPSLVTTEGGLLPTNVFRLRALLGRLPLVELEREISAQIELVAASGVSISHVDSHRHVHKLPNVLRALANVLPRYGISRVRTVQNLYLRRPLASPTVWLGARWRRALTGIFETTEHFYMPTTTMDRDWDEALLGIAGTLSGGALEIGIHPGSDEQWRRDELAAVERFSSAARRSGLSLAGWNMLPRGTPAGASRTHVINSERKVSIGD